MTATPLTASYIVQFNAAETIDRELSPTITARQTAGFTYGYAVDPVLVQPRSTSPRAGLMLSKQFLFDTLSASFATAYAHISASEGTAAAVVPPSDSVTNSLSAVWGREWSSTVTSSATVGLTQAVGTFASVSSPGGTTYAPLGIATLMYSLDYASALVSLSHQPTLNVATGTNNVSDQALVRASLPVGRTGVLATGSVAFTHAVPVSVTTGSTATSDVWLADIALAYTPPVARSITTGIRGFAARQLSSDPTQPNASRWGAAITLAYSYPSAGSALARPDLAPQASPPFDRPPPAGSSTEPWPNEQEPGEPDSQ